MIPDVSVVIPTFNRCDSLRITLDGLSRQVASGITFEVVVVSDGSTDGTSDMVSAYASSAPFLLRLVTQPNGGPARARNRGIREACGELVVFLDDDVEPAPDFVARHRAYHDNNDHLGVVGPMLPDPERSSTEPVWIAWEHAMLRKQYSAWNSGEWTGVGPHHFYSGNASVRREHLVAVGGFNEEFGRQEDVELAVRLEAERHLTFRFASDAPGVHRPQRTFASWLKVPFSYGSLDVARAHADNGVSWGLVQHGYVSRNLATRVLADICLRFDFLYPFLRLLLLTMANLAYRIHRQAVAFALLSAMYNVHYLKGAAQAMGSISALRALMKTPEPHCFSAIFNKNTAKVSG